MTKCQFGVGSRVERRWCGGGSGVAVRWCDGGSMEGQRRVGRGLEEGPRWGGGGATRWRVCFDEGYYEDAPRLKGRCLEGYGAVP